jgi:hypothetical protein
MQKLVVWLLLSAFSVDSDAGPREDAILLFQQAPQLNSVASRMEYFSSRFVGIPYADQGPLGEGETGRFDQDPLYRFDFFDCTTFVETTLSLSLSTSVDEFETTMNRIRYENGVVDYLKRNHFPSLQWIPNNIQNGLLQEVNSWLLPKQEQKTAEAVIDLGSWLNHASIQTIQIPGVSSDEKNRLLEELKQYASIFSPVIAKLDYLPISTLVLNPILLAKIPSGTIVSFVRPNWDLTASIGTHMNVSHQGLIFQKNEKTILRHASSGAEKRVVEVPLLDYLRSIQNHPTLKGIHLLFPKQR